MVNKLIYGASMGVCKCLQSMKILGTKRVVYKTNVKKKIMKIRVV